MKYLKQFVIGSSYLVFAPFYYAVLKNNVKNYTYEDYTLIAPVWLGLWNVISLIIAESFNLSMRMRFIIISVISSVCIMIISTLFKTYNKNRDEWISYYLKMFLKYMIIWNIVIYNIEKYI